MQIAAIDSVVTDRTVTPHKGHIPFLALAEVTKGSVALPFVVVAIGSATLSSYEENHMVPLGRAYAALFLPAVLGV
jgi:hypothetical protein